MKVAAIQHDIAWEDRGTTLARLRPQVAAAAASGAQLVSVTEMFATGFSMATHLTAEAPDGPTVTWMLEQAATHDIWLAGSYPERAPGRDLPSNTLVVAGADGTLHRYAKIHPFSYAGEHERFDAGDRHVTVELDGVRWTLFVCYDLRFADEFWATARDTDAYLVVANWPEPRRHHWRILLDARAVENQAYVVGVNRVGQGGALTYVGDSRIVDPTGEVLSAAAGGETILLADIDPEVVTATRKQLPFLPDRRTG